MENEKLTRRSFFQMAVAAISIVPFALNATKAISAECPKAPPAGKSIASPTEGMGKSLEYVVSASTSKNAKYKSGDACGNCKFYNQAKADGGYAPCTMMGMKYVTNCGWCKSYSKKA
jgi:High potential iron-sulfur protein